MEFSSEEKEPLFKNMKKYCLKEVQVAAMKLLALLLVVLIWVAIPLDIYFFINIWIHLPVTEAISQFLFEISSAFSSTFGLVYLWKRRSFLEESFTKLSSFDCWLTMVICGFGLSNLSFAIFIDYYEGYFAGATHLRDFLLEADFGIRMVYLILMISFWTSTLCSVLTSCLFFIITRIIIGKVREFYGHLERHLTVEDAIEKHKLMEVEVLKSLGEMKG
jgi:hypothetical protein